MSIVTYDKIGVQNTLFGSTISGGNLAMRANSVDTTGSINILTTTSSTSISTGALVVDGGVGINGNVNISGNCVAPTVAGSNSTSGNLILTANTSDTTGTINIPTTTSSTSAMAGALVVAGGVGIGGNAVIGTGSNLIAPTVTGSITPGSNLFVRANIGDATGTVFLTTGTASTTTNTGLLVVSGGVGVIGAVNIGGSVNVNGNVDIINDLIAPTIAGSTVSGHGLTLEANTADTTGTISIPTATASTTTGTGAVVLTGGLGVANNINVGGNLVSPIIAGSTASGNNLTMRANTAGTTGTINIPTTTVSTSASTGAAVVLAGGLGVSNNINVGGDLIAPIVAGSTVSGNNLTLRANTADTTGTINIPTTTASTSASTGALVVSGGIGVTGTVNVNGNVNINGNLISNTITGYTITSTTLITSPTVAGSIVAGSTVSGGDLTIEANTADTTGTVFINTATASTTDTTGALVILGGVGVVGNINAGGNINASGSGQVSGSFRISNDSSNPYLNIGDGLSTTGFIMAYSNTNGSYFTSALAGDGNIRQTSTTNNINIGIGTTSPQLIVENTGISLPLTPTHDDSQTQMLARNSANGTVVYRLSTTFMPTETIITQTSVPDHFSGGSLSMTANVYHNEVTARFSSTANFTSTASINTYFGAVGSGGFSSAIAPTTPQEFIIQYTTGTVQLGKITIGKDGTTGNTDWGIAPVSWVGLAYNYVSYAPSATVILNSPFTITWLLN